MGMCGERNTWLSCFVAHAQHNTARTIDEGEELGKGGNITHVASLNVTENQQDREDSSRDLKPEHWKDNKSASKESSRRRTACM